MTEQHKQNFSAEEINEYIKTQVNEARTILVLEDVKNVISVYKQSGNMAKAKELAQQALNNWQADGKTEIKNKFEEWLKNEKINLDQA